MAIQAIYLHGGVSGLAKGGSFDFSSAVDAGAAASSALDAIEASICILEDDPLSNAGRGAALTAARVGNLIEDGVEPQTACEKVIE